MKLGMVGLGRMGSNMVRCLLGAGSVWGLERGYCQMIGGEPKHDEKH